MFQSFGEKRTLCIDMDHVSRLKPLANERVSRGHNKQRNTGCNEYNVEHDALLVESVNIVMQA